MSDIKKQQIAKGQFSFNFRERDWSGSNNPRFGSHCTEETKNKIRQARCQQVWINDGKTDKIISKHDLNRYIDSGFVLGRLKGKSTLNKIWITNNIINKIIDPKELEYYLNLGFRRGKIHYKNKNRD